MSVTSITANAKTQSVKLILILSMPWPRAD